MINLSTTNLTDLRPLCNSCCRIVSVLYSISFGLTCAERLASREDFASTGWLPWSIVGFDTLTRPDRMLYLRKPQLYKSLFDKKAMSQFMLTGLVGTVLMLASPVSSLLFTTGVFLTVLSGFTLQVRSVYGGDGAQQMNMILGAALLLGFNPWISPIAGIICLTFVAAQACLSYFASGVAKLISPLWRSGDALPRILSTTAYGSAAAYRLSQRSLSLTRMLCKATVLLEVLFPVLLVLPKELFFAFLVWGIMFHLSIAFLMGLNTFFWSFIATYPAIYFVWTLLHSTFMRGLKL
jgi:hypothetical protein